MLANWVFIVALVFMGLGEILYLNVLRKQYKLFKQKSALQPLKYMLFGSVVALVIGALPLMFVYANIVWFHFQSIHIIYVAVLANAISKPVVGAVLNLVYDFRIK